jgi:hypothetical protein
VLPPLSGDWRVVCCFLLLAGMQLGDVLAGVREGGARAGHQVAGGKLIVKTMCLLGGRQEECRQGRCGRSPLLMHTERLGAYAVH